jgi:hypothetical protein
MQRPNRPQLPAPPNQLTAHNIKVSSFVTISKTRLNHHQHFFVSLAFTPKVEQLW